MSHDEEQPDLASESGRPASSDDPVTRSAASWPDEVPEIDAPAEEAVLEELRALGWNGVPFVIHEGEVLGNSALYEAAERLGLTDRVPRIGLREVFREAGFDFDQFVEGYDPHDDGAETLAEDFLSELPRHIRDKYSI